MTQNDSSLAENDTSLASDDGSWSSTSLTDGKIPVRGHDFEPVRGPRPQVGYIGIQNHHEPQTVHCREISVLPLPD
jgi:hypothetical protein